MKIINKNTQALLYNTVGDEVYPVTQEFWDCLKAGKVQYMDGGVTEDGTCYSEPKALSLEDPNFEKLFDEIYNTGRGAAVMMGELPPDTML